MLREKSGVFKIIMMLVLTLTWALVNWSDGEGAHSDLEAFLQPELPIITVCPEGPPTCQFTKIQDAINSAPEDFSHPSLINPAAIIQVAPGVYEESLLILNKSVILRGADRDRVFLRPPKNKNDSRRDFFSIFISGSYVIVDISGFTIQGAPIAIMGVGGWPVSGVAITENRFEKSGIGIYGTDSPIYIERNAFLSCSGIEAAYVGWLRILKNAFDDCWRYNINIEGASLLSAEKPRVLIAENMEAIVRISAGSHDIVIRENTLSVSDSEVVTIIGNVIHEGSGVVVYNSRDIVISANQIENNRGNGITIEYLYNQKEPSVQIVNNRIIRNDRFGILTEKLEYVTVCQGNEIRENREGDYGVGSVFPQPSPELKAKCEGG
ncbi:MAG: right-handed parallel beta-helix repeat-containing protein [Candidatus Bipolaricaulota bacterium]|nr:right-handed parallel beta-helix repeat-containing protein [Candidatus Bipolaricaulota bacterium]